MAEVVVLVVGYRNADDIRGCLRALDAMDAAPTFDVYIAENGGPAGMDALTAMLDAGDPCWTRADDVEPAVVPDAGLRRRNYRLTGRRGSGGLVHVVEACDNLGYAGGVNLWLRALLEAPGWRAAWILNPDTQPRPNALAALAACSASRGKGMVGSLIVDDDDPDVILMRGLAWRKWTGRCVAVGRQESAAIEPEIAAIEAGLTAPSGASLYVTRALIGRIGLMYDPYFLYCEDLEWGDRAMRLGELGYAHESVVLHAHGTTIGSSQRYAERSPLAAYLGARNTILFAWRNYRAWLPAAIAMQLLQSGRLLTSGAFGPFAFSLRGVIAGCLGETGRPNLIRSPPTARGAEPAAREMSA